MTLASMEGVGRHMGSGCVRRVERGEREVSRHRIGDEQFFGGESKRPGERYGRDRCEGVRKNNRRK